MVFNKSSMAFAAAAPGYIGGCIAKWIFPKTPVFPFGCAAATMYMIPVAFGCSFIAWKIASLIHKKLEPYAGIAGFLGGITWIIVGSLTFSANPVLSPTIFVLSFAVILTADYVCGSQTVP